MKNIKKTICLTMAMSIASQTVAFGSVVAAKPKATPQKTKKKKVDQRKKVTDTQQAQTLYETIKDFCNNNKKTTIAIAAATGTAVLSGAAFLLYNVFGKKMPKTEPTFFQKLKSYWVFGAAGIGGASVLAVLLYRWLKDANPNDDNSDNLDDNNRDLDSSARINTGSKLFILNPRNATKKETSPATVDSIETEVQDSEPVRTTLELELKTPEAVRYQHIPRRPSQESPAIELDALTGNLEEPVPEPEDDTRLVDNPLFPETMTLIAEEEEEEEGKLLDSLTEESKRPYDNDGRQPWYQEWEKHQERQEKKIKPIRRKVLFSKKKPEPAPTLKEEKPETALRTDKATKKIIEESKQALEDAAAVKKEIKDMQDATSAQLKEATSPIFEITDETEDLRASSIEIPRAVPAISEPKEVAPVEEKLTTDQTPGISLRESTIGSQDLGASVLGRMPKDNFGSKTASAQEQPEQDGESLLVAPPKVPRKKKAKPLSESSNVRQSFHERPKKSFSEKPKRKKRKRKKKTNVTAELDTLRKVLGKRRKKLSGDQEQDRPDQDEFIKKYLKSQERKQATDGEKRIKKKKQDAQATAAFEQPLHLMKKQAKDLRKRILTTTMIKREEEDKAAATEFDDDSVDDSFYKPKKPKKSEIKPKLKAKRAPVKRQQKPKKKHKSDFRPRM